jgi:hypothetical protein
MGGCGAATGYTSTTPPISVTVPATVTVSQDGQPVVVDIFIDSTSETALVSFIGLPGGIQDKYSASDTNPSGTLTFTASSATPPGSNKVTVVVNSAGQSASTTFTMIVSAAGN